MNTENYELMQQLVIRGLRELPGTLSYAIKVLDEKDFSDPYDQLFVDMRIRFYKKQEVSMEPSTFHHPSHFSLVNGLINVIPYQYNFVFETSVKQYVSNLKMFTLKNKLLLDQIEIDEFVAKYNELQYGAKKFKSIARLAEERIKEREWERSAPSTGYKEFDRITGGWIPGRLYTFFGDTNAGKTTMCCNFSAKVIEQERSVLYFSLEPDKKILDILASVVLKRRYSDLVDEDIKTLNDNEFLKIILKNDVKSVNDLVSIIKHEERHALIIIDHIGYFIDDTNQRFNNMSNIIKILAGLAQEKQCAILQIAHVKKPSNARPGWKPTRFDISGTAAFYQDATDVFMIHRDHKNKKFGVLTVEKTKSSTEETDWNVPIIYGQGKARILSHAEATQIQGELTPEDL